MNPSEERGMSCSLVAQYSYASRATMIASQRWSARLHIPVSPYGSHMWGHHAALPVLKIMA